MKSCLVTASPQHDSSTPLCLFPQLEKEPSNGTTLRELLWEGLTLVNAQGLSGTYPIYIFLKSLITEYNKSIIEGRKLR